MFATVKPNAFKVRHSIRTDVGREFITIDVPNGWNDVKKVHKKVLTYDGKDFLFTGWNSDRNEAFFARPLNGELKMGHFK